mgnify:FL=1
MATECAYPFPLLSEHPDSQVILLDQRLKEIEMRLSEIEALLRHRGDG